MKIVHVTEPFSGGIVTFLVYQCNYLPQHDHIVVHGERTTADHKNDVRKRFSRQSRFLEWPFSQRKINLVKDLLSIISLIKILNHIDADVIHLHSSKAGFAGRIAAVLLNKKNVVYTPHAPAFDRKDISKITRRIYLSIEKLLFKLVPETMCCSKAEADLFSANGMPVKYIKNSISLRKRIFSFPEDEKITIGFVGILTHQKRPDWFNKISEAFVNESRIRFIWIGDGPLKNEIKTKKVEVLGWKSHGEVRDLLDTIDLFLSCSAWEGLPYAVLEAMEAGKPLLLSNLPIHKELIHEEKNGWIFNDPEEAIEIIQNKIFNSEELRSKGKKSREICEERFNISKNIVEYKKYYESISARKI